MIRARLLLAATFGPAKGRGPLADAMHEAGMSRGAIFRFLGDGLEHVADVEIGDDGATRVLAVRRRERCPAVHERGERCSLDELHEEEVHVAMVPTRDGMEVLRWKDDR